MVMATRFFGSGGDEKPEPTRAHGKSSTPQELPSPPSAPEPPTGCDRRLALLIGNGAYPGGQLRNPTRDVDLLGQALRDLSFEVEIVHDAGKAALEHAIVAFGAQLTEAGSDAVALFYFAGHGIQHQGQNYLVPVDARIPEVRFLRSGAVRLDFLLEELSQAPRRANVIVLDACRNNPIRQAATGGDALQGLAAVENVPDATAIVFSTSAGAEAADGDGENSPYALALMHALSRSGAKLQDVVFAAASAVGEATGGQQRPALFVQGALADVTLTKPNKAARSQPRNDGPWGKGPSEADVAPGTGASDAGWRMPDPETTIERLFPQHQLRYGLSARDWEQGFPGDLVNEVVSTGRWGEVEKGFAAREHYAATLVAIRSMVAIRQDWGRPDLDLAARAARIGADAGIRQAFIVLGWLHQNGGGGFPRDPKVDRGILAALANRGYRYAQLQYGIRLAFGVDGKPEPAEAIGWLEQAAAQGAHAALYEIGRLYTDTVRVPHRIDFEKARHYLERAAATGHVAATSLLAILHLDGKLPRADRAEAVRLLELAAGAGDATALFRRGMMFEHGDGVPASLEQATLDFTAAAGAGSVDAMLALAAHAAFGVGDRLADPAAAVRWTQQAADKGALSAMVLLGRLYETGFGVPADASAAATWYDAATAAGAPMGLLGLARLAVRAGGASVDATAIRRRLEPVLAGPDGEPRQRAERLLAELDCRARLAAAPTLTRLDEIAEGPAGAPVTVVVFQSLASPACGRLHAEVLQPLRARFVANGHVRLIYREAMLEPGTDAAVILRAAGRSMQMTVMARLLATQADWCGGQQGHAALARVLADLGYDEQRVWKDSADPAVLSPVLYMAGKIAPDLGVRAVPTVFVNGRSLVRPTLAEVEGSILCALPPEVAYQIKGGTTFGLI
jgi:TPR repeat protein